MSYRIRRRRTPVERIPLSADTADLLRRQLERFKEKFGREPGPNDPVFFDPEAPEPQPMTREQLTQAEEKMAEAMVQAGIAPEIAYAYRVCGC